MRVCRVQGTTAEWPSLTTDEREALARAWRAAIPVGTDGPKLILHIGHNALPDAHRLAIVAAELKYDGVLVSAPSLFVAPTVELQVESVVAALAGVGLPAFYYRYVPLYGDSFDAVELMRALKARLPNIVGIKVSGGEKAETLSELCAETAVILTGAGNTIPGLARGARGIVAYPWESRLFRKVIDAVAADGPEAAEAKAALDIIDRSRAAIGEANVPTETGNYQITGAKAFADASGLRVGPCRLPLPSVPASERAALRDRVAPLLSEGAAEATKG